MLETTQQEGEEEKDIQKPKMSSCNFGAPKLLPASETPLYCSYLHSTRPDNTPPAFVSFRFRSGSASRSSLKDTVSLRDDEQRAASFYELLGIPDTGSLLEIKQAYKQLARKYHPDVSPPGRVEEYTQRFIRVQEAYETLSDPRRKELYDREIERGFQFAFNSRRRSQFNEQTGDKNEWKNRWQSQVSDLKKRSMYKESTDSMSWAARMRMERNEPSSS